MALEFTDKADIPESMQNDFVEFEKDGKTVFIPEDTASALKAQFRLQGDLTSMSESQEKLQSQMNELSEANAKAEKAITDEKEAIRKQGLSADEQMKEMLDDMKKRMDEQKQSFDNEVQKLTQEANQKTLDATVAEFATVATPSNQKILQMMIKNDIQINPDGSTIIKDENGKATSLTLGEYKDSLPERYPTLTTAVQSEGGAGKGNNGDNVALGDKSFSEAKTPAEKAAALAKKYNRKT